MKCQEVSKFQEQFWLLNMMSPKSAAYNIPALVRFDRQLNTKWVEIAINTIVNRHEILRSSYSFADGLLTQIVHAANENFVNLKIEVVTYENESDLVQYILEKDINKPFVLDNPPLIRCSYYTNSANNKGFLCIVFHHIVVDLHSKGLFESEISEIYLSLSKGKDPFLKPIEVQYADFSCWHNQWLKTEKCIEKTHNWVGELPDINTSLTLPLDYERPRFSRLLGKRLYFSFELELSKKIELYSKEQSISNFLFLLSCYAILMHKISGQSKIIIGVPYSNRKEVSSKDAFGPFVNALPVVVDVDASTTLAEIFKAIRNQMLMNHRRQEIPFTSLVAASTNKRNTAINPYYQTGFTFEPPMNLELGENIGLSIPVERDGAQLDLFLTMWHSQSMFHGYFEYSSELFKESTAKQWLGNFEVVVSSILSGHCVTVGDVQVVRQSDGIDHKSGYYRAVNLENSFVHEMFSKQAVKIPEKQAVICNNESISYAELELLSSQIALYLKEMGVSGNDIVGLSLNRSILMVACTLGILKAGAAYLPLDPSFPNDRLSYMLDDSSSKFLITETSLTHNIETGVRKIFIDQLVNEIKHKPVEKIDANITSDSLAYLIYTSGSTGMPKGVKVHHAAVVNFVESMAETPGFSENDRLLAVTTLSFDISVLEIFLPLYKGGLVVLAQKHEVINGLALISLMEKYGVTMLQATPATWSLLLHSRWQGNLSLKALCGGEPIPGSLIKQLLPLVSQIWNMYGPTETTVWSTCCQISSAEPPILVGTPINNTSVYILSETNEVLENSNTGEVCIGGLGVTKGYHNRDDLTKSRFVNLKSGELVYKTGDLGKIRPDSQIELFGRIDNQIKLRGFRIEPGEIEVQLCKIEGVSEAVVKVQSFGDLDQRLVAFLKVTDHFLLDAEKISNRLKENLPDYMVPMHYKVMSDFPRTPNGKIDKKALIIDEIVTEVSQNNFPAKPLNLKELEKSILEIWKHILKNERITINDNFFDLGGNSLLLMQVSSAINNLLGKEIEMLYLFEYPTVGSLSNYLAASALSFGVGKAEEPVGNNRFNQVVARRRQ